MPEWNDIKRDELEPGRIVDLFIEKTSGRSYAGFMKAEIFDPLGMKHTVVEDPSLVVRGCVSGYDFVDGRFVGCGFLNMTHVSAAGDLMSSVGDLTIWNAALDASRLVSARAVRSRQDVSVGANPGRTSAESGPSRPQRTYPSSGSSSKPAGGGSALRSQEVPADVWRAYPTASRRS